MTEQAKAPETTTETAAPAVIDPTLVGKGAEDLNKLHINIERPNLVKQEMTFSFRKFKNELGEEVKRPSLKLEVPVLTIDGLINSLQDEKQQAYVLDILADTIKAAARLQIDDEATPVNTQADLDLSKLTIEFLANQPKSERTGGGISKELWEAWAADYMAVMMSATDAKEEHVKNAVTIFLKRYAPVKTLKQVLAKLRERLAIYATNTKNLDEFADVVEFLDKKAETLLAADEASLLENL